MKARIGLVLALILVLTALGPLAVSAQSGAWVSGITIQNQSDTATANIVVRFFWAEGTGQPGQSAGTKTDTIPPSGSVTYYVPDLVLDGNQSLPDGFKGSAVVESDQPVVANVNTQVPTNLGTVPTDPNRVGTASGVLEPASTLYFTQLMREYFGWNSYMAIQNTTGSPATVTVRYFNSTDGMEVTGAVQTAAISAYSTYVFEQQAHTGLPSGWAGSAVVTVPSPALVAGVANFFNDGATNQTAQFHSYNPFTSGATTLFVPRLVRNYYDYQGGLTIQNVGTADANVTIEYFFSGTRYEQTVTGIRPNASYILYAPDIPVLQGVNDAGSAVVQSTNGQPIVAIVNEDNRLGNAIPTHEGRGSTYNAILDGSGTNAVFFSQFTSRFYGYSGGIQVQNVGTAATTVAAVFSAPGFADVTLTANLQPNASVQWYGPDALPTYWDFNGSVVVTAGQPIVGIANMSSRTDHDTRFPTNYGDSFLQYNGVNVVMDPS